MSDMIQAGIAWQMAQLQAYASQTVTYASGYDQVDVLATFAITRVSSKSADGSSKVEYTDKDFLIKASDLKFDCEQIRPERGHLVFWTVGDDVNVYEVRPVGYEPPWRWADPHETTYLIHTKFVRTDIGAAP